MCKLLLDFAVAAINYDPLSFWSITKVFLAFRELQIPIMYEIMIGHHQIENII